MTMICSAVCAALAGPAMAAETELDALDLTSAPVQETARASPFRLFAEGALGSSDRRFGQGSEALRRGSLDVFYSERLAPAWRAVLSDRFDSIHPAQPGSRESLNSLREAYVGWDGDGGANVVEAGRINLRYGPAYGFNPTDFFRDGALRSVTTLNPFALRENRLGTAMLRGQHLWQTGAVSLALAPKLADAPSTSTFDTDFGATNNRNRALLAFSQKFSDRVSGQVLLYKEAGRDVQPGLSLTALLGNAVVAHAEWSHAREPGLAGRVGLAAAEQRSGNRAAGGLTYTTSNKLSLTAEVQASSFALRRDQWSTLAAANPAAAGAYLLEAERRQDLASRRAYLVYAAQKDLAIKNLDLTAFLRINADDHSRLAWLEMRYHWATVDAAIQWQRYSGAVFSQYGLNPDRQVLQLVAAYHFQ